MFAALSSPSETTVGEVLEMKYHEAGEYTPLQTTTKSLLLQVGTPAESAAKRSQSRNR